LVHQQQSKEACQELFSDRRFVFFLDSVDELGDNAAISLINKLYNPGQWHASIFVLTCRSEVLSDSVISQALPPREFLPLGPVQGSLMVNLYLLPFSAAQQEQYVTVFATQNTDLHVGWDPARYLNAIQEFPDVKDFLQEPLQLYLVLSVLPILMAGKQDLRNGGGGECCATHQGVVAHTIHVLYQEPNLEAAQKLAEALEAHPVARQKGLRVFLKASCVAVGSKMDAAERHDVCCRHLPLADVIIPLVSTAVGDDTAHFLHAVEVALGCEKANHQAKICPLYVSCSPPDAEKALLPTAMKVSQTAAQSIKALSKLQGGILNKSNVENQSRLDAFVAKVIDEFAARE
jgi:hypothetical protein